MSIEKFTKVTDDKDSGLIKLISMASVEVKTNLEQLFLIVKNKLRLNGSKSFISGMVFGCCDAAWYVYLYIFYHIT